MEKEKVLSILKKQNKYSEILNGDYISIFKRIGENKSINKVLSIKPDFFANYLDSSFDIIFISDELFDIFSVLSKLAVLKSMNIDMDFKSILFFTNNNQLLISEEVGVIKEKNQIDYIDSINFINELKNDFEKKIGKKIILNII